MGIKKKFNILKSSFLVLSILLPYSPLSNTNVFANEEESIKTNIKENSIYSNEPSANSNYILGPGDWLKIIISRDYPELNTKAIINGEGYVFVPKLNKIYVAGLTVAELK